jgi:hypothetical protein
MTTGSASFEGSSARKTLPEALLNSEMPSATWLLVGSLFPAAMIMLCGTSNVVGATAGAVRAGGPYATLVRSEAAFGSRLEAEAATGDRSSIAGAVSRGFLDFEARTDAGALTAVSFSAFSTLYR